MSDSDEDYMSDKLLVGCNKEDIRPGLLFNMSQKRKHELFKKQQEDRLKKPRTYHEQEKEMREKGLNTAISSDNKGFKLLEKMGYKAGTGLGKTIAGIVEPVAIKTKDDTSGVGRDDHLKEIVQKKKDMKEITFKIKETEFCSANAERRSLNMLRKDYRKGQRICEELDLKSGIEAPEMSHFWSKETQAAMKRKNKQESEEDGADADTEDEGEEISEPKLCDVIIYLRRKYCYCIYCGDYVKDSQGMVLSCPGYFRRDHDD